MRFSSSVVVEADPTFTGATAVIFDGTAEAAEPRPVLVDKLMLSEVDRAGSRMQSTMNRRSTLKKDSQFGHSTLIERMSAAGDHPIGIHSGVKMKIVRLDSSLEDPDHEA